MTTSSGVSKKVTMGAMAITAIANNPSQSARICIVIVAVAAILVQGILDMRKE